MKRLKVTPTQFSVTDFIDWQREGALDLSPVFQRRSVWKPGAKSYFIDTLARGLPVPLIFLRERVALANQDIKQEVVDGQQRLRTVFAFVDETLLPDFNQQRDRFTVGRRHNPDLGGKPFRELDRRDKDRILGYRFSVQILPRSVEDRDVLAIFARLNSTGTKLNSQELRNAAYFGAFKTLMYDLAYEQLERWRDWEIFSEDQIARMIEVELVSDLTFNMIHGLSGKLQSAIDREYDHHDTQFQAGREVARRFRGVMDAIEDVYGSSFGNSSFRRVMHFFRLFAYLYDHMYGLGSSLQRTKPRPLRRTLPERLRKVDRRFAGERLPRDVLEAVSGAATDIGRRETRLKFMASICDGKTP